MTNEQISEYAENVNSKSDKCRLRKALEILEKYTDKEIEMYASNEELSFGIKNYEDISDEDIKSILDTGIYWSEEYESFFIFT